MTKLADQIRQGADQAWESLSEGWREISTRASGALTRFWPSPQPAKNAPDIPHRSGVRMTSWAFLAADVIESADKVIIRI
jgi:HSP20 family protein